MKLIMKIITKSQIEKQYERTLKAEQDYELATLSHAIKNKDEKEIERSKKRLIEIHNELNSMAFYA